MFAKKRNDVSKKRIIFHSFTIEMTNNIDGSRRKNNTAADYELLLYKHD